MTGYRVIDREDVLFFDDRVVTTTYGAHGLRRVLVEHDDGRYTIRWYWEGFRVPWIVWAMFR